MPYPAVLRSPDLSTKGSLKPGLLAHPQHSSLRPQVSAAPTNHTETSAQEEPQDQARGGAEQISRDYIDEYLIPLHAAPNSPLCQEMLAARSTVIASARCGNGFVRRSRPTTTASLSPLVAALSPPLRTPAGFAQRRLQSAVGTGQSRFFFPLGRIDGGKVPVTQAAAAALWLSRIAIYIHLRTRLLTSRP